MKSLSNWEFTVVAHAAPQSAMTDKVIHGILFGGLFFYKTFQRVSKKLSCSQMTLVTQRKK